MGQIGGCGGSTQEQEPHASTASTASLELDPASSSGLDHASTSTSLDYDFDDPLRVARSALSTTRGLTTSSAMSGDDAVPVVLSDDTPPTVPEIAAGPAHILSATQVPGTLDGTKLATAFGTTTGLPAHLAKLVLNSNATATENWPGAQLKIQQQPAWSSWVQSRKATIDAWAAVPRERADLLAGYMHDYVDPTSGLPLTWTPQTPEPPVGTTVRQKKLHDAWVFHLRSYNITRLGDAARVFRATNDTRYRDWAAAQLDFYATNYNLWPLRKLNGRGRLFQHGLDEATAVFTLLDAARLLTGYVANTRSDHWRRNLFAPMAVNLQTVDSPLSNIGLWHAAAVARIGMRYRDSALVNWGLTGTLGTRTTLATALNADDMWNEGSFGYNAYVIDALNALATAAALEGYAPSQVAVERVALARLLLSPLNMRFDNGSLPTPGDASPLPAIDSNRHASVYRSMPTWWGVKRAQSMQTWDTLLQPPPALPAAPLLPAVTSRNFAASRMAVLRAGNWQAFVHYGQATNNHAQEEAFTYELHEGTQALSSDSGTASYTSPYHLNYFSKGASHNVPLVDGLGQQRWAPGVVDMFDASNSALRVTHAAYQPRVDVTRQLQAATAGLLETTSMLSSDGIARRMGSAFHTNCSITPASGLTPIRIGSVMPPATTSTAYWTKLQPYLAGSRWSILLSCGTANYLYRVTGPASHRVFLGAAPTTPLPSSRSVLYYETNAVTAKFEIQVSKK